jgi:outer membrane protein assembly factor BamA
LGADARRRHLQPAQVERDLQAILSLGFFDKVETRVTIEDGPRGGFIVTFYVKELPIIRDIQFEGLHSVPESDVLKTFRERRVGISKEAILDPSNSRLLNASLKSCCPRKDIQTPL